MIATALDHFTAPPSAKLLGWHLLDARPEEWLDPHRLRWKERVLQSGRLRAGRHSLRDARRHHGAGRVRHDRRKTLHSDHHHDGEFPGAGKAGADHGEANVTQLGKTIAFVEGRLTAEDGALLATATASARLVDTAKAIR